MTVPGGMSGRVAGRDVAVVGVGSAVGPASGSSCSGTEGGKGAESEKRLLHLLLGRRAGWVGVGGLGDGGRGVGDDASGHGFPSPRVFRNDARVVVRERRSRLQALVIRRGVRVRAGRGAKSESCNDRTQLRNSSLKDRDAGIERSQGNAVSASDLGTEVASA